MGCKYVKEFIFGKGGIVPEATKKAVAKHEKAMHPNQPPTKLKAGGKVAEKCGGGKVQK